MAIPHAFSRRRHSLRWPIHATLWLLLGLSAVASADPETTLAASEASAAGAATVQADTESNPLPEPMSLDDVHSGRLLFSGGEQSGKLYPAPILDTDVSMQVSGLIARVTVTQTFRNPSQYWLNGIYVFPLPENSAVDHLRMQIGERVIEGQILEKQKAREQYELARREGKSAALTEQLRPNMFRNSVANIGPGEEIKVTIEYQQQVQYKAGEFSLRFPMTIGTRYIPGNPQVSGFDGNGWAQNTDQVPDASQITPPVTAVGNGADNPVTLTAELDPGLPLSEITSPYHRISRQNEADHKVRVTLDGPVPADRDFVLQWRVRDDLVPQAALFTQSMDNDTYGLLMLIPPQKADTSNRLPRELIFVIDTSGSMGGTSLDQAKEALKMGLSGLTPADTFNLVQFNSYTDKLFSGPVPADAQHLEQANRYVARLQATGGTEIASALDAVLDGKEHPQRVRQVVFLTDGAVGNEQELFDLIGKRLGDSRLFTVGIGSAPNSYFMSEAAAVGRGTFTYIGDVNEVQERMGGLLRQLANPVLADLHLEWDGQGSLEYSPDPLQDLYAQEPLMVSLRLPGAINGQHITVRGRINGQDWSNTIPLNGGGNSRGLDILWARNRIAALQRSLSRGADPDKVRDKIAGLGLAHHIVTPYTSLVAIDQQVRRDPQTEPSHDAQVPVKQPHGWTLPTPGTPPRMAMPAGRRPANGWGRNPHDMMSATSQPHAQALPIPDVGMLPQTATPAGLLLDTGVLLLLLALGLGWVGLRRGETRA